MNSVRWRSASQRVIALLAFSALLAGLGAWLSVGVRDEIQGVVESGERSYEARGPLGSSTIGVDRPVARELGTQMPIELRPVEAAVATVQVPGAPAGYVMTRGADGCWRLPSLGRCWRAVHIR